MTSNIEGKAAKNMAGADQYKNSLANPLMGLALMSSAFGGNKTAESAEGQTAVRGRAERSAEDWHNEDVMKNRDLKRERSRINMNHSAVKKATAEGRTVKQISADGKGGFNHVFENAPAPKSEKPESKSTVVKGQQFDKPMPSFSIPGPNGRRVSNPEYGKWKSELNSVNASTTAGNASPLGIPKSPGQAPRAPRGPKA